MSLALTYDQLRKEVGYFLGYGRTETTKQVTTVDPVTAVATTETVKGWTSDESEEIDRTVSSGLRQFYFPPPVMGERTSHAWSFLKPVLSIKTVSTVGDYDMPPDFGGFIGNLAYASGDNAWATVKKTSGDRVRLLRQQTTNNSAWDKPVLYAVEPKSVAGIGEQRWMLLLYPTPQGAYTMSGKYMVIPEQIDAQAMYHRGGTQHAETVLASCLAIAEQELDGDRGVKTALFMERLNASIALDRQMNDPEFLGYNGEGGEILDYQRGPDSLTYNGVTY